jgi:hypothetical protein
MLNTPRSADRKRFGRSATANDPLSLPGVSACSKDGRRFREIAEALVADYGDVDPFIVRELAGLKLMLERQHEEILRGDRQSLEDLVRLSNVVERKEKALRLRVRQRPAPKLDALRDRLDVIRPGAPT